MLHEVIGLDAHLVGELFDGHALAQRHLAGWTDELEQAPGDGRGLLAGVAARRLRACLGLVLTRLGHDDVGSQIVIDNLRTAERSLREQLVVDFLWTLRLAAFPRSLLLDTELVSATIAAGLLAANTHRRAWRGRRGRRAHRTSRTTTWAKTLTRTTRTTTRTAGTAWTEALAGATGATSRTARTTGAGAHRRTRSTRTTGTTGARATGPTRSGGTGSNGATGTGRAEVCCRRLAGIVWTRTLRRPCTRTGRAGRAAIVVRLRCDGARRMGGRRCSSGGRTDRVGRSGGWRGDHR